jgi:hypothetical protein
MSSAKHATLWSLTSILGKNISWFQTFTIFFIPTHLRRWNTGCSKMLAYKIQMPGNHPEESIQQKLFSYLKSLTKMCDVLKPLSQWDNFSITCSDVWAQSKPKWQASYPSHTNDLPLPSDQSSQTEVPSPIHNTSTHHLTHNYCQ